MTSYYSRHVFFCCNQRDDGSPCCEDHDASSLRNYCKQQVKALGLAGQGKLRINSAGCLDRCAQGPTLVVYPEAVWYRYENRSDIDEIVAEHLVAGRIVERLKL